MYFCIYVTRGSTNCTCGTVMSPFISDCFIYRLSDLDNTLDCDEGWVGYKGYCYYFSDELLTFDEAYNFCLTNHSLIVTFTMGLHEAKFVEETIQSRYRFQMFYERVLPNSGSFHIFLFW